VNVLYNLGKKSADLINIPAGSLPTQYLSQRASSFYFLTATIVLDTHDSRLAGVQDQSDRAVMACGLKWKVKSMATNGRRKQ